VKIVAGQELAVFQWLAHEQGQLETDLVAQLVQLKAGLEAESEVAIVFGAEVTGAAIAQVVAFGSKLPGKTRYLALGDYANSRGAADMGLLPDRLPGYAYVDDAKA
jgi:NADH-quinone oxidoreductase subunit G